MSNSNGKIITIVLLATIFGMASGLVGTIMARVYLLEEAFKLPMFGEISFMDSGYNGAGLVIRDARKVVVEQNTKVRETAEALRANIAGIYPRKPENDYYDLNAPLSEGFIITSDGWIISPLSPAGLGALSGDATPAQAAARERIYDSYVVITHDRKIFKVLEILKDPNGPYSFWRIDSQDLPVRGFTPRSDIFSGQLVLAVNSRGWVSLDYINELQRGGKLILSSEEFNTRIILDNGNIGPAHFLFDLRGDLLGLIAADGVVEPVSNYLSCISCLLDGKDLLRPRFGAYYIDLSDHYNPEISQTRGALIAQNAQGVAVVKGGPAEKAGLRAGDIILEVDNTEVNRQITLSELIGSKQPGDEIRLDVLRGEERLSLNVTLDSREL